MNYTLQQYELIVQLLETNMIDIDNAMKLLEYGFEGTDAKIKLEMETIETDLP